MEIGTDKRSDRGIDIKTVRDSQKNVTSFLCLESTQRHTKADILTDRQLDKETDKKSYHVAAHCALNVPELHLNNLS